MRRAFPLIYAACVCTPAALLDPQPVAVPEDTDAVLTNWSGTKTITPSRVVYAGSTEEVAAVVEEAHARRSPLRVVGTGLSPNGIGFSHNSALSVSLMDGIISVDEGSRTVTVQAGAKIGDLGVALLKHGLTLPNYASIAEQTVAGFTQVSAHGSGATIAPLDEYVVGMTIVTPGEGVLKLDAASHPRLFKLARVALGALGVVTEVTLRCVPAYRVATTVEVLTRAEVRARHGDILRDNLHVVYNWFPYVDAVLVTANNPVPAGTTVSLAPGSADVGLGAMKALAPPGSDTQGMSFADVRRVLLAPDPLDTQAVKRFNAAEVEYWKAQAAMGGLRSVDFTHAALQFDCGGSQLVSEVALPAGTLANPTLADLDFVEAILGGIEAANIPAPPPIEQRWSAASSSPMSPAAGAPGDLVSWVGVIMYMPTEDPEQRAAVQEAFAAYRKMCQGHWEAFGAIEHWAKAENDGPEVSAWNRRRLAHRLPLAEFAEARRRLDPHGVLGTPLVEALVAPLPKA